MYNEAFVAALNHLLRQNAWAPERLARFAEKNVRFDVAPFTLSCTIHHDGSIRSADAAASADARCIIAPSLLPRLALHDEKAHAEILTEGDEALLAEIFYLSRNLRWDAAEDLSPVTGDIMAERIVQTLNGAQRQLRDSALNFSQAVAEYFTEERPLLAKPQQVAAFIQQVDALRDDVARLEKRINQISENPVRKK